MSQEKLLEEALQVIEELLYTHDHSKYRWTCARAHKLAGNIREVLDKKPEEVASPSQLHLKLWPEEVSDQI